MPLDPQLQPILDFLGDAVSVDGKTPEQARQMSPLPPRDETGISSIEDIKVQGADGLIPARVYRPEGLAPGGPVIVYYHGGGWVIASVDTHDGTCIRLAVETPCTVVSIDYRMAPEHKFPAPVEDAYSATVWVAEHAAELGVDAGRLVVAGDSAGGNLAAAVALMARERGGPAIAYQLLIYPVTDVTQEHPSYAENGDPGWILSSAGMRWFIDHYVGGVEGVDWRASPLVAEDFSGLPPAFVVTAELDPLRDEGEAYADRLTAAGVPTRRLQGAGMCHGFYSFPVDEADRIRREVEAALREALQA